MPLELTLTRTLTDEELAALGHDVVDPVAWATYAMEKLGPRVLELKIAKTLPEYQAERERLGDAYKTRAERQAEEDAAEEARRLEAEQLRAAELARQEEAEAARFQAAVAAAVAALAENP